MRPVVSPEPDFCPGITLNSVFSDFTSTSSPDIPTSWSLIRNSVKPSDSPRSHPLSRILSPFMPLSHSFPTQKGRIKRPLQWVANALYALSATHFLDKKKSPVEPEFFMGDFSENSVYFEKSKLYFLKSKPYFFESVLISEKLIPKTDERKKAGNHLWSIPWRSGEGPPSPWKPHGQRDVKGWRVLGQVQYGRGDGQIENRLCDEYLVGSFSIAYWIHLDILVSGSQNITGMLR